MKFRSSVALAAALSLFAACKSTGGAASSTVSDLKDLRAELAEGRGAVTGATTALQELAKEGGDMAAEFKTFDKAVDTVAKQSTRVRKITDSIAKRRDAFLQSWDESLATMQNESMRERASERREKVESTFRYLQESGQETRRSFDAWMSDVVDARTYLENDLNPAGVKSLDKSIKSIVGGADDVNEDMDDLVEKLDEVIEALDAARPPAEA
jgi:ABC-type transporter Mla subunit MlaD